jgi:hypothetical protein
MDIFMIVVFVLVVAALFILALASLIAFWKLQTTTPSPLGDEETDSIEDSPSEVTPAPSPHFMAEFESSGGVKKRETDSTEDSLSEDTPPYSPRQSGHLAPPGDANTGSNWLGVGCSVGGIMLCGFLIFCVIAISMLINALGAFLEGVEDFFNVFKNVFKGG